MATDKSKEAMNLALEALKRMKRYGNTFAYRSSEQNPYEQVCDAIAAIEALAEQPEQGCDYCKHPLYAGTKCKNCEREQPAQQEPEHIVHSNGRYSPLLTRMMNNRVESNVKQVIELYDSPEQPAQHEPVGYVRPEVLAALKRGVRWGGERLSPCADEEDGLTAPIYTSPPAQRPHECSRSHPHENMDAMCELRTKIARLTNENARLKAQPQQEPVKHELQCICGCSWEIDADGNEELVFSPPAQRTWVGLTDEEIDRALDAAKVPELPGGYESVELEIARAIEAAIRARGNT